MNKNQNKRNLILLSLTVFLLTFTAGISTASEPVLVSLTIRFDKGTTVNDLGKKELEKLLVNLEKINVSKIVIEGFSDNFPLSSNNPYSTNKELSKARADNVALYLEQRAKIPRKLFVSSGFGSKNPIATNATKQGRAANRRAEIQVYGTYLTNKVTPNFDNKINQEELNDTLPTIPVKVSKPLSLSLLKEELITVSFRDVDVSEAFEMLSKKGKVNIIVEVGVAGKTSLNLFDVTLTEAIYSIAQAGGFIVEKNDIGFVVKIKKPLKAVVVPPVVTEVKTFKVQYADSETVEKILAKHLSSSGKISALKERGLLVVEDTPANLNRIEVMLSEVDREPKQILIEAKILEITLDETESFGLDWWKIFTKSDNLLGIDNDGTGSAGVKGLSNATTGFIFNLVNDNVNITLNALNEKGRVKTLSTPKLLTIENQEASVIIGDRKGYKVTTTIDQVTSESVEFLESGIILNVIPSVDNQGRILLEIHPEVSSGSVTGGIPSQTTTEVTTTLLADSGQTIFIGGLLKKKSDFTKDGVPVLGDIPIFGRIFSSTKDIQENTETVVLITPYILSKDNKHLLDLEAKKVDEASAELDKSE